MHRRNILFLLRLGVGGLFVYAGALKAMDPSRFLMDIESFRMLPYTLAVAMALYLPWLEMICGGGLILRKLDRGALACLLALLTAFLAAILVAWCRGLDISCGCLGAHSGRTSHSWLVARDLGLLAAGFVLAVEAFKRQDSAVA